MTHKRAHLSDEALEARLRGLPRREPSPDLRRRILAAAWQPRRVGLRHPAFAFAMLMVLLLADLLVVGNQQSAPGLGSSSTATVVQAQAPSREEIALLRELDPSGLPLRLALRQQSHPASYFETRTRILNEP
jgi:hypothetical protein